MVGERLKFAREAVGLCQADVARALNLSTSGVSSLEHGTREPKASQLAVLGQRHETSFLLRETLWKTVRVRRSGQPATHESPYRLPRQIQQLSALGCAERACRLRLRLLPRRVESNGCVPDHAVFLIGRVAAVPVIE